MLKVMEVEEYRMVSGLFAIREIRIL